MTAAAFVAYHRPIRTMPPAEPSVSLRSKGGIAVNKAAFSLLTELLGCRPAKLELLYCPASHTMGVRGQVANNGDFFKVFHQGIGSSTIFTAVASGYFDRFGLCSGNVAVEQWFPAYIPAGEDFLHVPLARPDGAAVVTTYSMP